MESDSQDLEGMVWWNIYGDINPHRVCDEDAHITALGESAKFAPFPIGLLCVQCGMTRLATEQYFDTFSLLYQDGKNIPDFEKPSKYYPLATTSPVCRFCQLNMFSTYHATHEAAKLTIKRPVHIYELLWPVGDREMTPFYVGQTNDPVTRFRQHCLDELAAYRYHNNPTDKAILIGNFLEDGIPPVMVVVGTCRPEEAKYRETERIVQLTKLEVPLVNRRAEHTSKFGYMPNQLQKQLKEVWDANFDRAIAPE